MTNEQFQELVINQLKTLTGEVKTLTNEVKEIKSNQHKLEVRIENEVIDKIGILFDGHSLRGDQIENLKKHIDERLDSIEIDTGYLVSRVSRLEKIAK